MINNDPSESKRCKDIMPHFNTTLKKKKSKGIAVNENYQNIEKPNGITKNTKCKIIWC